MSTSQGTVSVRGATTMSGSVAQSTHAEAPRAVDCACRAARRFRRAWWRCWAGAAGEGCAQGWAPVSSVPGLGAGAEARPAVVRATHGLPFADGLPSRGVGARAWPMALFHEYWVACRAFLRGTVGDCVRTLCRGDGSLRLSAWRATPLEGGVAQVRPRPPLNVIVIPSTPAVSLSPCWVDWRLMTTPC